MTIQKHSSLRRTRKGASCIISNLFSPSEHISHISHGPGSNQ